MVALIPARAGSKRIPGKNLKLFRGHPLIAYTIAAAKQSGVFTDVLVSSEDDATLRLARKYGAGAIWRPPAYSSDTAPDILWVKQVLLRLKESGHRPDAFAILRPTAPFRTAETIRRCAREFHAPDQTVDSMRAVEPAQQSPYKMWVLPYEFGPLKPLLEGKHPDGTPYHSSPTQTCPIVYVQNASLEMSWTSNVEVYGTLTGRKICPFVTRDLEGFDLNTPADWREAEHLAACYPDRLPPVDVARVSSTAQT